MKNERGFGLIEVIIALALLGLISVAFLGALSTASRAILISDERTTAESIARSQMEHVKNQGYKEVVISGGEATYDKIDASDGYFIWSVNRNSETVEDIIGVPWDSQLTPPPEGQAVANDVGLQRIKLVVKHGTKGVIILEDYKVER